MDGNTFKMDTQTVQLSVPSDIDTAANKERHIDIYYISDRYKDHVIVNALQPVSILHEGFLHTTLVGVH